MTRPWPRGAVTGIGSLPGTDPVDAAALVFGELPDFPHVVELPDRGPGAEMVGRGAALLVEVPVEIVPSGWRIAAHTGRDLRRSRDHLARDLDALEQQADGYTGPLKLQLCGPWTLAASLELPSGHKVITDRGAVRDLIASLAEGARVHVADVVHRVPGATPVLQLDEPSLPAVLGGRVPTPSGYGTVRAVEANVVEQGLGDVLSVAPEGGRVVHCCSSDAPLGLLRGCGADALALDASLFDRSHYDDLGAAVDTGLSLWLGVVGATGREPDLDRARDVIRRLWSELGFPAELLATSVVPTPTCGLAGASPERVRRALAVLRDCGRWVSDGDD